MATIDKLVALVARNFPRARIWLTEYGYQSNPPDRLLGVSPALQARYVGEGSYVAYRTPRVDMLIHFLVRDEPNIARFQSGVLTLAGKAKPAYGAYRASVRGDRAHGKPHRALGPAARARRGWHGAHRAPQRRRLAHGRDAQSGGRTVLPLDGNAAARHAGAPARRQHRRAGAHDRLAPTRRS